MANSEEQKPQTLEELKRKVRELEKLEKEAIQETALNTVEILIKKIQNEELTVKTSVLTLTQTFMFLLTALSDETDLKKQLKDTREKSDSIFDFLQENDDNKDFGISLADIILIFINMIDTFFQEEKMTDILDDIKNIEEN